MEDAIDGGAETDEIADAGRVKESQAVHGRGDDGFPRVPHRGHGAGHIHQVHYLSAQDVAQGVGVGGQRQFRAFRGGFAYGFALHLCSMRRR